MRGTPLIFTFFIPGVSRTMRPISTSPMNTNLQRILLLLCFLPVLWGATTGSISGTLTDPSGAVIPGAAVIVTSTAQGLMNKTTTDAKGVYSFPSLPVGTYDLKVE